MKDSVLRKYTGSSKPKEVAPLPEAEGLDDFGAFGFLRGIRDRAIMLELRKKDGTIAVFGYAWLSKTTFDPSDGITLHFGSDTVKISGRNLQAEIRPNMRLFSAIVRHRVPWIQEADGAAAIQAPKGGVVVEEIDID